MKMYILVDFIEIKIQNVGVHNKHNKEYFTFKLLSIFFTFS